MAGKVAKMIKLIVPAGQAKPAPPVGTLLGGAGLNIMSFCKDFNAKTANVMDGTPIPVEIEAYEDKTFTYIMRTPPTTFFLLKAAGLTKGATYPGKEVAGYVSLKHIYEIARIKQSDPALNHLTLKQLCKQLVDGAATLGIEVVARPEDAPTRK